jgi:hypothetical protein
MIKIARSRGKPWRGDWFPCTGGFALWQGTPWRAGRFRFGAAPRGDVESDADQNCRGAAEATAGPGMMREDERGDQSQIQPDRAAQTSQNAPARPPASSEQFGHREHGGMLGVVQSPALAGRLIGPADLPRVCHSCRDKKPGTRHRREDEHCP